MKKLLVIIILFFSQLHALTLKDKFQKGQPGDYIITEKDKTYSVFLFKSLIDQSLLIEEISIPSHVFPKKSNWRSYLESGAKGNTSWLVYTIDLEKNSISQCFSKTRKTYIAMEDADSLLLNLLKLKLEKVSDRDRKRIGPPPQSGPDYRKLWNPPYWFNGVIKKSAPFDVFQTTWPKDASDLSGKRIELYFEALNGTFPFPYWMHISDGSNTFKIRIIDSGRELSAY